MCVAAIIGQHLAKILPVKPYWWFSSFPFATTTKHFLYSPNKKTDGILQCHDGLKVWIWGTGERNQTTEHQQHLALCPLSSSYFILFQESILQESRLRAACHQHAAEEDNANQSNEERPGAWASCCSPIHRSHRKPSLHVWLCHQSQRRPFRYISWQEVLQRGYNKSYGLLEVKCPDQYSYTGCQYLQKHSNDSYSLKRNHEYYYQVIGQMGITGMPWCDFFVKCDNDYHLERIHFDAEMWKKMKTKLDWFFFEYFLPALCS